MSSEFCNILVTWGPTRVSQKFCNILLTWESTRVSQKFCNILVTWHNSAALDAFAKVLKMTNHWSVRWRAHLILTKCYSLELLLWLEAQPWNSKFYAYLIWLDCQGSCDPSKISWTISLLYCNHLTFHLLHKNVFGASGVLWPSFNP